VYKFIETMKTVKFLAIALAALSMSFSACKKEEEKTETPKVAGSTLLTGKDWRVSALTIVSAGGTIDVLAAMQACEKDDLQEFMANGNIVNKAGATKCDPADPDTEPGGTWAFLDNDTKFRVIDGDTSIAEVVELTATKFRVKLVENDNGTVYTTNATFVKN
jgi:hypothetical protein